MQNYKLTEKQKEALLILSGIAKHVLIRGGARSGKTFLLVLAVVVRALKATSSRHLIVRKHFAHVKQSIWLDTMPVVFELCFPGLANLCRFDKSNWYVTLPNRSEVWIGGLDEKERTDKILGKEYSTIYFNECSEISYESVGIAQTRLSQKNSLSKKFFYDCNPPKENHWSNKLFIRKINPLVETGELIDNPQDYATIKINPRDNVDNIDPEYIPDILEKLPPALRLRFLDGEYGSDDTDVIRAEWLVPSVGLTMDSIQAKFSFCDPAYTEKARATENTCESSIVTVGIDYDGIIHDIEVLHGYWSYEELKRNCIAVNARHKTCGTYVFGIEDVAAQRWLHDDLGNVGVSTVLIKPDNDKIRRTISITDLMEQGKTRTNNPALMNQLLGFPGEKLKDLVDAYVGCLKMVKLYGSDKYERPKKEFEGLDSISIKFWKEHKEQKEQKKGGSIGDFYRGIL